MTTPLDQAKAAVMAAAGAQGSAHHVVMTRGSSADHDRHDLMTERLAGAVADLITAAQAAAPAGATPRDEWPDDANTAIGHLAGLAFDAGRGEQIGHCVGLINAAVKGRLTTADPVVPEYSDAWLLGRAAEAGKTVAAIERALPGAMTIASAHLPAAADPVRAALADLLTLTEPLLKKFVWTADKAGEVTAIVSAARAALAAPPKISPDRLPPKPAQLVSMADESFDIKSGPRRRATVVRAALAPQPVVQEQPGEPSRENDGDISLDWCTANNALLSISVSKTGRLIYAVNGFGAKDSGTVQVSPLVFHVLERVVAEQEQLTKDGKADSAGA